MDFAYSDEQQMLRDSVLRYGEEHWAAADRLKTLAAGPEMTKRRWAEMAELGWLMLPIAESDGGLGGSAADVMAVMEGVGRHLMAVPYVTSCVLVPALLEGSEAGAELLGEIGAGTAVAAAGFLEADSGYDLRHVTTRTVRHGEGWRLSGAKVHVEDGADADWFVVSARTAGADHESDGIGLFLIDRAAEGLAVDGSRAIDGHRHARLMLDDVAAIPVGDVEAATPVIEAAVDRAIAAQLAEAVGSMEAASEATLDHLRTRHQFGVAIGSFQVLQHRMVDMVVAGEEARSMAYHATLNLGRDPHTRTRAVSAGKVRVAESGVYVGQQAVQLHGGVGFSEELIVSHHLRRQMMLAQAFGNADHHRTRFARLGAGA
ncbi:acyl-CoA dehydrogenase [Sphingomonas sp. KR1UV-12]|uniref:Acyl-CoA dehydrogenase n=1 Tax=Sphingomonas aurea TaxID=3063994 RepID=A0ABT9EKW7_9SPHN|nr:acyl-CoA dehydrogenase [Sphingomonas sp. KR1UV-12]MDP1027618.1 acyl-CoA dehydrogenase [Sphingomonas sp. KR1UV-12]